MNKLRSLLLTFLILALVAGGLPITESLAKWSRRSSVGQRKKSRYQRRHSRAWWRRYRARMREKRERAARRRTRRQEVSTSSQPLPATANTSLAAPVAAVNIPTAAPNAPKARLPFGLVVPQTWSVARAGAPGVVKFNVGTPDGRHAGTAMLEPIAIETADVAQLTTARTKTIGGATLASLRRTVIDRMVAEGGWVVNDVVREMQGRKVFVVLAQTGTPGAPDKSWTFYFTEVDGRIYRLATTVPIELAEPVAAGSEKLMASLRSSGNRALASQ